MDWYAKKCWFENFKLTHDILSQVLTGMSWAGQT